MPPSRPSNVKLLTEGAQYIKRKRRQDNGGGGREKQIDKILFNDDDRAEFLTGFSKRKQAKLAEKRERAKKRDEDELKAQKKEVGPFVAAAACRRTLLRSADARPHCVHSPDAD